MRLLGASPFSLRKDCRSERRCAARICTRVSRLRASVHKSLFTTGSVSMPNGQPNRRPTQFRCLLTEEPQFPAFPSSHKNLDFGTKLQLDGRATAQGPPNI